MYCSSGNGLWMILDHIMLDTEAMWCSWSSALSRLARQCETIEDDSYWQKRKHAETQYTILIFSLTLIPLFTSLDTYLIYEKLNSLKLKWTRRTLCRVKLKFKWDLEMTIPHGSTLGPWILGTSHWTLQTGYESSTNPLWETRDQRSGPRAWQLYGINKGADKVLTPVQLWIVLSVFSLPI